MASWTTPPDQTDPVVERMVSNARRIVAKIGRGEITRAAAKAHDRPPRDFLVALRSPAKSPVCVTVDLGGMEVTVDLTPIGHIDRDAEQRAWDCVRRVAAEHAA